jgi:hypothetical protein
MSNHTPGPWKALYKREGDPAHVEDANGELVAIVTRWGGEDTHLIAAAPELLGLAREAAEVAETVAALLCSPGEATKVELVSMITGLGTRAAALINNTTKEEA